MLQTTLIPMEDWLHQDQPCGLDMDPLALNWTRFVRGF